LGLPAAGSAVSGVRIDARRLAGAREPVAAGEHVVPGVPARRGRADGRPRPGPPAARAPPGSARADLAPLMRILPPGATRDAAVLLQTRGVRAFGDGLVSVVLAGYLAAVGLSDARIGIVVATTLLGSAALTLGVGLRGHHVGRRRLLQLVSVLLIV